MEVKLDGIRRTGGGNVVADLFISDGGEGVKFCLYMKRRGEVALEFGTTNKNRAELAVRLLKEAGVNAKVYVKKEVWHVAASLKGLAKAGKPLKEAVVASIRTAAERGWIDERSARRWIARIKCAYAYNVGEKLAIYSKRREVLEREAQLLREMGLEEGRHFLVKMPEGGGVGRLRILARGLERIAWLSVRGTGRQRELARELLGRILCAASTEGGDVYRKVKRAVDRGVSRSPLTLKGFEKEVGGRVVRIRGGSARLGRDGRLRVAVAAEVDGVYTICEVFFVKMKRGGVAGFAKADATDDAERAAVVVEALTGVRPTVVRMNGIYTLRLNERHLRALVRYAEFADYAERWMES